MPNSAESGIFDPKSIAVVGASSDSRKVGYAVLRNLMNYPGRLYAVNPKSQEILGHKTYPSLSAIEGDVDMIVVAVPAQFVPDIIREAAKKRTKLAVVISAGFREVGDEGAALEMKLVAAGKETGIRIVGPNYLGIMLPHIRINATFDPVGPIPGRIAFISQSGATITTVVDWSLQERVGFSAIVSVGNQIDLGFNDYLRFAAEDADTESIILYIEEIRNGREFMEAVREVSQKKPVVAIKSGESKLGQKAASSHTGSLAGSYEVYMAAFEQSDVIASHSLKEAFQIGELLASEGHPQGKRAIIISNAGGFAVLATDYAERYGIEVAQLHEDMVAELNAILTPEWSHENPMDLVGDADSDRYAKVFDVMTRHQDKWDIAFVVSVPTAVLDPRHLASEIIRFSRSAHKMIVGCLLGGDSIKGGVGTLRQASIPNFSELEESFRAVGHAIDWVRMTSMGR